MAPTPVDAMLLFGPFALQPRRKLLLEADQPVRLGSRALDLLVALVERAGDVVSREELVARIWPDTVVEDTSLRVHASRLRKALRDGEDGARYIVNVPGRGYAFVARVVRAPMDATLGAAAAQVDLTGSPQHLIQLLVAALGLVHDAVPPQTSALLSLLQKSPAAPALHSAMR